MISRVADLRRKEVIDSVSGVRVGFIDDVEIDTLTASVRSVVIFGRPRLLGIFGKSEDVIIPWSDITLIGEDTVLVATNVRNKQKTIKQSKFFR
ncbi:MAG: YlmC/YmxH family sporulation protein [Clostridia bacterium]|nr:YlmC/YmxH family sporulation protein [Clostridia bacterium]